MVNITSESRTVWLTVIRAFPIPAWVSLQNKKEHFSKRYNGDFTCEELKPRRLKDKTKTNNSHNSPKFCVIPSLVLIPQMLIKLLTPSSPSRLSGDNQIRNQMLMINLRHRNDKFCISGLKTNQDILPLLLRAF